MTREFFGGKGKSVENTIYQLNRKKLIQSSNKPLDGPWAYQISESGARVVDCPISRAESLGSESLPKNLAILWFSYYGNKRRTRLEESEIAHPKLFGFKPEGIHCFQPDGLRFEDGGVYPFVFQIIHLGPGTRIDRALDRASTHLEYIKEQSTLQHFLTLRLYRFAILSNSKKKLTDFVRNAARKGLDRTMPLEPQLVPTPKLFKKFMKGIDENEISKSHDRIQRSQTTA
ncbi:MAG: hypothetical protein KC994_25675 [Candidatus Omnitrophica bacterium]|nr:hypothetical protein [Candidatus Omnitrophota bacterium]